MKHDDAQPSRTPLALVLVAAFGAGLAGGLAAHWIDGSAAEPAPERVPAREAGEMAAVAAEIRALTQAVQALAAKPGSGAAVADRAAREPEPLRPEPNAELEAALTRLTDAWATTGAPRAAITDRAAMELPADPQAARSRIDALLDRDGGEVKKEHFFLSVRAVVERYGLPDSIEVNDRTVALVYQAADGGWQKFTMLDGMVTNYARFK
jgi:hypothetical protein